MTAFYRELKKEGKSSCEALSILLPTIPSRMRSFMAGKSKISQIGEFVKKVGISSCD